MSPRVVAFVHAKGTSTRVPGKNLRLLGDRPLFLHAVRIALAARRVDEVVIDSDHDEILRRGGEAGATPLRRPAELASDAATGDDLMRWQAGSRPDAGIVVQVIPTAPFLEPDSVDRAVALLDEHPELHSVAGVAREALYLWRDHRPDYFTPDGRIPNSGDMAPCVWETTGLYAARAAWVRAHGRRLDPESVRGMMLSKLESVDVNTPEDFALAELLWHGLQVRDALHPAVPSRRDRVEPRRPAPGP